MSSTDSRADPQGIRRVIAASFIGTTIEWHDFFLYGTAAALVFNKLFFPHSTPSRGTLLALATYGVGFAARPVGGILFGHYGDRIGRKAMLVLSLLIMGIATFLIGVMPTYSAIGIAAPLILVILRLAQGIGVGGEWGGAVLMSVEHAPPGRRGFFGSWPQMGVPAGLFLSTSVFALVQLFTSDEQFLSWGWRVPFLLSIVLVAVGLFIRLRLLESPAFQRVKDTDTLASKPIVDVVRKYPKQVGAVRHQGALQRRLARLPVGVGVRRWLRPPDRHGAAGRLRLSRGGHLHGLHGADHHRDHLPGERDLQGGHLRRARRRARPGARGPVRARTRGAVGGLSGSASVLDGPSRGGQAPGMR
jgi:MFS family permease